MKDVTLFNCRDCDEFTYVDSDKIEEAKHLSCAFCDSEYLEKVSEFWLRFDVD